MKKLVCDCGCKRFRRVHRYENENLVNEDRMIISQGTGQDRSVVLRFICFNCHKIVEEDRDE